MLFKVNDYVISCSSGVCQITDITKIEHSNGEAEYYVLHPVYKNNITIKIPVHNAEGLLRKPLTKNEVLSLISAMPDKEILTPADSRERNNILKSALKTWNSEDLIKVIKTLHLEKQAKSAVNKKLSKADEDMMNTAEKRLYEEFALALNISPEEVVTYILEYLEN